MSTLLANLSPSKGGRGGPVNSESYESCCVDVVKDFKTVCKSIELICGAAFLHFSTPMPLFPLPSTLHPSPHLPHSASPVVLAWETA